MAALAGEFVFFRFAAANILDASKGEEAASPTDHRFPSARFNYNTRTTIFSSG